MENNRENNSKNSDTNSWLMGLIAFILATISFWMDPYILVLFLDIIAMILAIIALVKNYRLKGFAITAIVIAAICMVLGVMDVAMTVMFGDNWEDKISYSNSANY